MCDSVIEGVGVKGRPLPTWGIEQKSTEGREKREECMEWCMWRRNISMGIRGHSFSVASPSWEFPETCVRDIDR